MIRLALAAGALAVAFAAGFWTAADHYRVSALRAERATLIEAQAATARLLDARAAREAELLASLDHIKETADALAIEARDRPAADRRLVRDRERLLAIRPRGPAGDTAARRGGGGALR